MENNENIMLVSFVYKNASVGPSLFLVPPVFTPLNTFGALATGHGGSRPVGA